MSKLKITKWSYVFNDESSEVWYDCQSVYRHGNGAEHVIVFHLAPDEYGYRTILCETGDYNKQNIKRQMMNAWKINGRFMINNTGLRP